MLSFQSHTKNQKDLLLKSLLIKNQTMCFENLKKYKK